ncbi:PREDICTED: CTD small phosphatase-like protein 2 isoform X3 [Nicotiana attenuata]|uniref:CTD small phosphatase-like protein 2 isoform X3 n=1 Tax=Nicotiana attenuata TaxID=49451 RepID=UPI000905611D|nr:PREDICTED: CTD small phosphatase-like protein 2 isoform X3 [Nicotiana attenuata]
MQTKKKLNGRNQRELASPKVSRQQRKMSENVQTQAKQVKELITSTVRKQKSGSNFLKKIENYVAATDLDVRFGLVSDDTSAASDAHDVVHEYNTITINKDYNVETDSCTNDTIFSPTFHISRTIGGEISNRADIPKFIEQADQPLQEPGKENIEVDLLTDIGGQHISSEVSAVHLSIKDSKLECIDEFNQVQLPADVSMEEEETEEFDDFDPYFFIKNLPDLYSVVPTFRPVLLPKQTRSCPSTTLVLDLDETLVHSTLEPCDDADFTFSVNFNLKDHNVYVRCRPHLRDFMDRVSSLFEIIIFTASQSIYAEKLLNVLDPKRKVFRHRVYRESCVFVDGNYLKDLSVLGRDLAHVIIIDNSPQAFGFQVDNGIPIESWFDDRSDKELLSLLPFLESLVGVKDVRPIIASKFNLRERIAAAATCPFNSIRGDAFER